MIIRIKKNRRGQLLQSKNAGRGGSNSFGREKGSGQTHHLAYKSSREGRGRRKSELVRDPTD